MWKNIEAILTKSLFLLCAIAVLGLSGSAQKPAELKKQEPPPPGKERLFTFPKYQTKKLANGLTVFAIEDHRQPLVSYHLMVNAGGIAHTGAQAGLASMTAELLTQGTESRSAQDIAKSIDGVGGSLSSSADDDAAHVSATVVKSSADLGIELLTDVVLHPAFKQDEIDRLLRQSLSGLQIRYSDPEYLAPVAAARIIFGEHPYGFPVEGTPDTLRAIKRDDIIQFHRQRYSPAGSVLAVSGDITAEEAFAKAEKYFAGWSTPQTAPLSPPAIPAPARKVLVIDKPDAVQTQIVVGTVGIKYNDPDYFALLIANQIFGGSFNSRLNMKLRVTEGLTYGARSSFDSEREAGMFRVSTFTRTEETARTISLLNDLLKEFRENPATEPEMKEAKAYLVGSFTINTETPQQVASRVLTMAEHGLPSDYWDKYRANVQAVKIEQISAAVRRHIEPEKMAIVAAGNSKIFAKDLEAFGPARTIHFTELDVARPDLERPKAAAAAAPETLARGMELIRSAAQAVGGAEALAGIKDSVAKAAVALATPQGELQAEVTVEVLYPDKIKVTASLPFGQSIQAFDGKTAWAQAGPQKMDLPPAMHKEMLKNVQIHSGIGLLREPLAGRAEVQALDPVEMEGKKMDVVLWKRDDNAIQVYLDPETHLIAKVSFRSTTPQGTADVESVWSDYREVSGIKVPWKETTYRNGQKFSELTVTERKFNTGLDPANFAKP